MTMSDGLPDLSIDDLVKMLGEKDIQIQRLALMVQRQRAELDSLRERAASDPA